jgi:hypothetical protein
MDSLIVYNLTEISKMVLFVFFPFNFFNGLNASVHESKCFDLVFAERKMMESCQIQCKNRISQANYSLRYHI